MKNWLNENGIKTDEVKAIEELKPLKTQKSWLKITLDWGELSIVLRKDNFVSFMAWRRGITDFTKETADYHRQTLSTTALFVSELQKARETIENL